MFQSKLFNICILKGNISEHFKGTSFTYIENLLNEKTAYFAIKILFLKV